MQEKRIQKYQKIMKYKIKLEVFKSNHLEVYEKEY